MKNIFFGAFLFATISCNVKDDFYYGTWDTNIENDVSTIKLYENNTISWNVRDFMFLENKKFKVSRLSPQKVSITSGVDKGCTKITMQKISKNQCIFYNYKCWIDENMVDEVAIARKNKKPLEQISKPEKQVILLPKDYEGEFFIVYQETQNSSLEKIIINDKGIGFNPGEPDFKQLFNANRVFKYEGQEDNIKLANPNNYRWDISQATDIRFKDNEVIVIQKGYNQYGRTLWNEDHKENVKNNLNIEGFEVRKYVDLK